MKFPLLDQMATLKLIPKGTILYLGHNAKTDTCPEVFFYEGQKNKSALKAKYFVGYFTIDEPTAEGYAQCFKPDRGWVNRYIVKEDFLLYDVTDEMTHYEPEEVETLYCEKYGGYYIEWVPDIDELAICDPWKFLEYKGSRACQGHRKFSEFRCITSA